mgnify:CR=1 FL=1
MSADNYLANLISQKRAPSLTLNDWRLTNIRSILTNWAGTQLSELKQSGSSAKGTAIKGVADFDIFISLKADTTQTLKEIFNLLDDRVKASGIPTRRQNVSIGITQQDLKIDLVPGKVQSGWQNYHSIYSSKKDTWMQTNIDLHISKVRNSNRQNEIILTKIWRENNKLDFPSIYLELIVIEALRNKRVGDLANNFWEVLKYLRDDFSTKRIEDPANTNNVISETLSQAGKSYIASKAKESLTKGTWGEIIW